jgi:hypothetical protein
VPLDGTAFGGVRRGAYVARAVTGGVFDVGFADRPRVEQFGLGGLDAMLLAHLVWDPAVTAIGIAEFGVAEEDNRLVRALWRLHPATWLAAKVLVVGTAAAVVLRLELHREASTAWVTYGIALLGLLGPLGWVELLLAN